MATRRDARVWLALITVYVVWGSTFIALAIAVRDLPPLLSMALSARASPVRRCSRSRFRGGDAESATRSGWPQVRAGLVFGGFLFLLGHGGLAWAQQTVPAGVAALLVGSIPIWMAAARPGRVRPTADASRRTAASCSASLGLAFLVDPFGEGSVDRLGAIVIVLARARVGGGLAVLARRERCRSAPLVSAGLASLCGGVLLLARVGG